MPCSQKKQIVMDLYIFTIAFRVKDFDKKRVRNFVSASFSDYMICYELMHDTIVALQRSGLYVISYDIQKSFFPENTPDNLKRFYSKCPY